MKNATTAVGREVLTPREAAIKLVEVYALRGDDVDHFGKGLLGSYNSEYKASIGGYIFDEDGALIQKVPNTKILVEQVGEEKVNEIFSLYEIWEYILQRKSQLTLL